MVTGMGICTAMAGIRMGLQSAHSVSSLELSRHMAEDVRQFSLGLAFKDPQGGGTFGPEESGPSLFDDVDDLDGLVQSPPIDSNGDERTNESGWTQTVIVKNLDPDTLEAADDGTTTLLLLTVNIERGDQLIGVYQWLTADR